MLSIYKSVRFSIILLFFILSNRVRAQDQFNFDTFALAVQRDDLDTLNSIAVAYPNFSNYRDLENGSLLHWTVLNHPSRRVLKWVINHFSDINVQDRFGNNSICRLLIDALHYRYPKYLNPSSTQVDYPGFDDADRWGKRLSDDQFEKYFDLTTIEYLLQYHCNLNLVTNNGATAMFVVAAIDYTPLTLLCLKYDPELNNKTWAHDTPLIIAAGCAKTETVRLFLEHGAKDTNCAALITSATRNDHRSLELLISHSTDSTRAMQYLTWENAGNIADPESMRMLISSNWDTREVLFETNVPSIKPPCVYVYSSFPESFFQMANQFDATPPAIMKQPKLLRNLYYEKAMLINTIWIIYALGIFTSLIWIYLRKASPPILLVRPVGSSLITLHGSNMHCWISVLAQCRGVAVVSVLLWTLVSALHLFDPLLRDTPRIAFIFASACTWLSIMAAAILHGHRIKFIRLAIFLGITLGFIGSIWMLLLFRAFFILCSDTRILVTFSCDLVAFLIITVKWIQLWLTYRKLPKDKGNSIPAKLTFTGLPDSQGNWDSSVNQSS